MTPEKPGEMAEQMCSMCGHSGVHPAGTKAGECLDCPICVAADYSEQRRYAADEVAPGPGQMEAEALEATARELTMTLHSYYGNMGQNVNSVWVEERILAALRDAHTAGARSRDAEVAQANEATTIAEGDKMAGARQYQQKIDRLLDELDGLRVDFRRERQAKAGVEVKLAEQDAEVAALREKADHFEKEAAENAIAHLTAEEKASRAERAGLEKAARVAEDPSNYSMVGGSTGDAYGTGKLIAKAIRALLPSQPADEVKESNKPGNL